MQILNFEIKEDVTFWMLNDIDRGKHNKQHNFQIQEKVENTLWWSKK